MTFPAPTASLQFVPPHFFEKFSYWVISQVCLHQCLQMFDWHMLINSIQRPRSTWLALVTSYTPEIMPSGNSKQYSLLHVLEENFFFLGGACSLCKIMEEIYRHSYTDQNFIMYRYLFL